MAKTDARVDAYISSAAEFARPILQHLRRVVHGACPEIEETLKWSCPHFEYKGMVCSMAAFRSHCTFGFWKSELLLGTPRGGSVKEEKAMGQFGRITTLADLPDTKTLTRLVKRAVELNAAGIKIPRTPKPKPSAPLSIPNDLVSAFEENPKAKAAFDRFSYSHKKEYVEWITEAKREETRARRLKMALDWMSEGKPRHWKYADGCNS